MSEGAVKSAILAWLSEGETGLSSKSLARETAGLPHPDKGYWRGIAAPSDPDDLRRCRLLIEAVPEARKAVDSLGTKDRRWAGLAKRWDEINELFEQEAAGGWKNPNHPTYRAMKEALGEIQ